ncbi:winged helix DNA-binding domain-containing protein [Rhodococcus sp. X156]|uniref:winged helix DNA-binding domain-containing protein n=1 Tax=Rhodococcus sp. X156 TaxID=2499145 RepID=UPI0013E39180|nr:winged helix DNA-binding domain-containing protein [Rhodococcus sp. X156]
MSGLRWGTAVAAARHLLAVQAQNLGDAGWTLGLRTTGLTEPAVAAALASGELVRTWTMRGTLHLCAPEDVRWLLALLGPRAYGGRSTLWRSCGLDEQQLTRARQVARVELAGDRLVARPALLGALADAGVPTAGQAGSHVLRYLAESATLVPGPPSGRTPTFALLDDWVPAGPAPSREEALARLAVRYVAGHGPATAKDLAWWSGLLLRDCQHALRLAGDELVEVSVAGEAHHVSASLLDRPADPAPRVHLLAGFDEYHIGYAHRRLILDDAHRATVGPAKNGLFRSPLLVDGRIAGTWSRTLRTRSVEITVDPFGELPPELAAPLAAARTAHAAFLERAETAPPG